MLSTVESETCSSSTTSQCQISRQLKTELCEDRHNDENHIGFALGSENRMMSREDLTLRLVRRERSPVGRAGEVLLAYGI